MAAYRDPVAAFFDRQVNERFGSSVTADKPQVVPQEVSQVFRRLYRDPCENVASSRGYHYPRDSVQFRDRLRGFVDFVGINLNADNCLGRVTQPAGIEQSNDVDELRVDQSFKPSSVPSLTPTSRAIPAFDARPSFCKMPPIFESRLPMRSAPFPI